MTAGMNYPLGGRGHTEDVLGNKVVAKIAKAPREIGRTGGVALACAIGLHCHSGLQEP